MNRTLNFFKRNLKEILRDPIIYVFCLGFPVVMLIMFQILNSYTNGNTLIFEMPSLLPAIIMFSYTFTMLTLSLLVSKDRQTMFLKRLYSSPMKSYQFILGYSFVGIIIGIGQTLICVLTSFIISLISKVEFISFVEIILLIVSQLPIMITFVFVGILFGTMFNDKGAPGICSALITIAGMLGGCWMPVDTMGNFELFCRFLPFYPSVYIGRAITNATKTFGTPYAFDSVALLGFIPIIICTIASIVLTIVLFKRKMTSDN